MKRSILAIVLALATLIAGSAVASAGNGAPQGPHEYQLNIIGVGKAKNVDMDDNNGHRIFVNLSGKTKINLTEGPDFAVLDANGTDGDGAEFMMPPPGYNAYDVNDPCGEEVTEPCDFTSEYSVYIRPLGQPGNGATMTTCATILEELEGYFSKTFKQVLTEAETDGSTCSTEQVAQQLQRKKGKSSFQNVTAELTSIMIVVQVEDDEGNLDEVTVRVPIFDDALDGEYWSYDNNGLRLAQVRFYDVCTDTRDNSVVECP
jgi:hypothetical protein